MKYGVREICNVVLKARDDMKVGSKAFKKGQPVLYFDTLKTSSLEGAATTVYAQGGRGNTRLVAWEGEKTITFTMEDALISPMGLAILANADLLEASADKKIKVHATEKVAYDGEKTSITLEETPATDLDVYYLGLDENGDIVTDAKKATVSGNTATIEAIADASAIMFDYYIEKTEKATQMTITAETFGGNFYLEADTLFRDQDGKDYPAEFIVPNCKVQSNFTFTMASTGDPSTFTFTLDAFPGTTIYDATQKVLAVVQVIDEVVED